MDENQVRLDPGRLRAAASRVERSADSLSRFRFAGLDAGDLPDSAVGGAARPAFIAALLDDVIVHLRVWADAARTAATRAEDADGDAAGRIGRS